jgi:cytoskeleton protein RodZ
VSSSLRLEPPFEDNAETPAPGALAVGTMLRRQREALGLDIGDVAAALRIKPAYLIALEAGCPDELPGPVYAIGFARAYADCLGLDGDELSKRFKLEAGLLAAKPELTLPIALAGRSMPGNGMLPVALILATCAYGMWLYFSAAESPRRERVAVVPAELLPGSERLDIHRRVSVPAEVLAVPSPRTAETPRAPETGSGSAHPAAAAPTMAMPHPSAATAVAGPAPEAAKGVVIRATADSWIQIRDARRSVLLARVLKAGESCHVPDQPGLSMRTSNAGGLEITVDGVRTPSLGRSGTIRQHIPLDAQRLRAGTAVRD